MGRGVGVGWERATERSCSWVKGHSPRFCPFSPFRRLSCHVHFNFHMLWHVCNATLKLPTQPAPPALLLPCSWPAPTCIFHRNEHSTAMSACKCTRKKSKLKLFARITKYSKQAKHLSSHAALWGNQFNEYFKCDKQFTLPLLPYSLSLAAVRLPQATRWHAQIVAVQLLISF